MTVENETFEIVVVPRTKTMPYVDPVTGMKKTYMNFVLANNTTIGDSPYMDFIKMEQDSPSDFYANIFGFENSPAVFGDPFNFSTSEKIKDSTMEESYFNNSSFAEAFMENAIENVASNQKEDIATNTDDVFGGVDLFGGTEKTGTENKNKNPDLGDLFGDVVAKKQEPENDETELLSKVKKSDLYVKSVNSNECYSLTISSELDFAKALPPETAAEYPDGLKIRLDEEDIKAIFRNTPESGGGLVVSLHELKDEKVIHLDDFASIKSLMGRIMMWFPSLEAAEIEENVKGYFRDAMEKLILESGAYMALTEEKHSNETDSIKKRLVFFRMDELPAEKHNLWSYGGESLHDKNSRTIAVPRNGKIGAWQWNESEKQFVWNDSFDLSELSSSGFEWFDNMGEYVEKEAYDVKNMSMAIAVNFASAIPSTENKNEIKPLILPSRIMNALEEMEETNALFAPKTFAKSSVAFVSSGLLWSRICRKEHEFNRRRIREEALEQTKKSFMERKSVMKIDSAKIREWFDSWKTTGKNMISEKSETTAGK